MQKGPGGSGLNGYSRERLGEGTAGVFGGSFCPPRPLRPEDVKTKSWIGVEIEELDSEPCLKDKAGDIL